MGFWNSRILPGEVRSWGWSAGRWTKQVAWRSVAFLHFFDSLACLFFGGAHFKHIVSTERERERRHHETVLHCCLETGFIRCHKLNSLPVIGGFLYWALFRCSSTSLGVTQITCWPFQYLTILSDCRVLMMSLCVMLVIWLRRLQTSESK